MTAGSSAPTPPSPTPSRTPTGMHDVMWPESVRWEDAVVRFATLTEGAGYGLALTPIVEHEAVFNRGIGEKSEVVGKEMYIFEDRDGQLMALRPEGTASVARAFVQHHHPVPPWKAWYVAPLFRHERPQQGRYRQHYQLGVETLGVGDADLDVEVIAARLHDYFAGFGLRQVTLKLNSMGDGVCRPEPTSPCSESSWRPGSSSSARPTGPATWRTRCASSTARHPSAGRPPRTHPVSSTTSATSAPHTSPGCARGSTRSGSPTPSITAWSAASTTTPAPRSSSSPRLSRPPRTGSAEAAATTGWPRCSGGDPTPGIGFGIGIERVLLACDAEGVFSTEAAVAARPLQAYVIDTAGGTEAVVLTAELRRAGLRADRAFEGRSMKSQIKSADRSGALVALVLGPKELETDSVGFRPLRSDQEQRAVPRNAVVAEVKQFVENAGPRHD